MSWGDHRLQGEGAGASLHENGNNMHVVMTGHAKKKRELGQMEKYGKWTLIREIGRGASGIVYLATGVDGGLAAVRICLRGELGADRYARELRGAKLYRGIPPGEGLVRLLELGEFEQGFYMAMELADDEFGGRPSGTPEYRPKTLARVIAGERALPVKEALEIGLALAKGLETLQRRHLLHRDVKPGNVVYVRGRPVLSDPGLLVDEAEAVSLVGTPGYVPPENFIGSGGDVYSLGLTLKAASFGRSVEELERGPMLEADTGNPLFPAWWRILNRATHPDPMRRYRSAKALRKDFLALRVRMYFMLRTFGLPRYAWCLLVVLAIVATASVFRVKTAIDYSESRWKELDDSIAEQVARSNEVTEQTIRDGYDNSVKWREEDVFRLEEKISEVERSIAKKEKLLAEKNRKADIESVKSRIEEDIRQRNSLLMEKAKKMKELEEAELARKVGLEKLEKEKRERLGRQRK